MQLTQTQLEQDFDYDDDGALIVVVFCSVCEFVNIIDRLCGQNYVNFLPGKNFNILIYANLKQEKIREKNFDLGF